MVRLDWRRARDDRRMAEAAREARLEALDNEASARTGPLSEPSSAGSPLVPGRGTSSPRSSSTDGAEYRVSPDPPPTAKEARFLARLGETTEGKTLTVTTRPAPERMVRITCGKRAYGIVVHGVAVRHLNALRPLGLRDDGTGRVSGSWTNPAVQHDPTLPLRLLRAVFDEGEIESLEFLG